MQHRLLQRNPYTDHTACPAVGKAVLNTVLDNRLQQYFGYGNRQQLLLICSHMIFKQILVAFLLDSTVLLHMGQLILKRDQILAATEPQLEHL
ncbi:hypothetical protein D3C75_608690 [compost metagenome]